MIKEEFLKEQFISLREEIKETKNRIFKIFGFGLVVIPSFEYLADRIQLQSVVFFLPLLIIVIALLYTSENHALMRCGRYIRLNIEPEIKGVVGWETWLEKKDNDSRTVDVYASYCFYILFFIYYAGSTVLASINALKKFGTVTGAAIIAAYTAIGIWFLIFLISNVRHTTTTKTDSL